VGVGLLLVEGLEELLLYGVEEVLLLGVAGLSEGGFFDGLVEAVERLEKGVTGEVLVCDRLNDLFNLGGDDVALKEFIIVEDLAKDALGEEVLDEHLLDGEVGEVGVDRLAAEVGEGLELFTEVGVLLVLGFEDFSDASGEVRDLLGELEDGFFPIDFVGQAMLEEVLEDFDEVFGFGKVAVEGDTVVLVEDGAVGGLEEDVGEGVAPGYFGFDLFLEVVGGVLGLPEAVDESEGVDEGSVGAEGLLVGAFELVLLDEVPVVRGGATLEQVGEGGAGVAFSGVAMLVELLKGGVVGLDVCGGGLEGKEAHRQMV
jgi:hypothetical protein